MSDVVLKVENLSKLYRLGYVGTRSLKDDLQRWWHRVRRLEDPFLKIGEANHRASKGESDYVWALKDINFKVRRGEVLGIIGKNGAGKSTLLKLLSKVTAPTTGLIKKDGRTASLLEVGTGFHPELTGRENIYLNGTILGMTKIEVKKKFDEIVDFAGVERYIDTPVKRYSSGMYVRLAFAVAAHLEPEILIVDEVLAVGDAEFQKKAIGKMKQVSEGGGRTVLFVSHNMGSILNLCSRCLLIRDGRLETDGRPKIVVKHYLNENQINADKGELLSVGNRQGSGKVKFSKVSFSDANGNLVKRIFSGEDLIVDLSFKLAEKIAIKKLHFSLQIVDELNRPLLHASNSVANGGEFNLEEGVTKGNVSCTLKDLPLLSGTYWMHLFCSDLSTVFDKIDFAVKLEVTAINFFNNGRENSPEYCTVLVKNTWKIYPQI